MDKKEVFALIEEKKLVPVVVLNREEDAEALGGALVRGGLPIAEVTFRTAAAEGSIRILREAYPDMLVGAGTVVNLEQAQRALDAGAAFIVTPGIDAQIIEFALAHDICIFPGTCTPTEIMIAMKYDLPVVKFFPAGQYGGLKTIKALAAPFPSMRFMPTGGVNADNVLEYLSFNKIIACGGSWMVKGDLIKEGNFAEVERLTAEAVALVQQG